MSSQVQKDFLDALTREVDRIEYMPGSRSMIKVGNHTALYLRYSRLHGDKKGFYGLRKSDLEQLRGMTAFLVFLWDDQPEPVLIPLDQVADVFGSTSPAEDGQYKTQIIIRPEGTEMYVARAGRVGIDGYYGFDLFRAAISEDACLRSEPELTHSEAQSLIAEIGLNSGFNVWIPTADRTGLSLTRSINQSLLDRLPSFGSESVNHIAAQIDALWLEPGTNRLAAAYEIEHSTSVYSGLLRVNDLYIDLKFNRAGIVAASDRRPLFLRQINRRTFEYSGLPKACVFHSYRELADWHGRIVGSKASI